MNILIVDDMPAIREVLKSLIKMLANSPNPPDFHEAGSADQAIALLRAGINYDAALIDYDMPSSGEGLAVVAVARARLPKARIALMSGRMDDDISALAKTAGADKALRKPAHTNEWRDFLFT